MLVRYLIAAIVLAGAPLVVGAGLAFVNPDEGDFEGGVNLLGGMGTRRKRMFPY